MADRTKLILAADAALLALLIAAPAVACLWDRDTLKAEADGLPGVVDAIVGRFPRPPALYYEMRLERVTGELETDPTQLALYDDAGVACDRLGRSDEAIEWMARKRAQLDQLDSASAEVAEHEYRYLANLGTFHAHRCFAGGANRDDLTDMERARELIAAAIDLNPDAHFGREKYQLLAIEYVLEPPPADDEQRYFPSLLDSIFEQYTDVRRIGADSVLAKLGYEDAAEGLGGLIILGAAWESLDVYYALALALDDVRHASIALLAAARCNELIQDGKRSIHPDQPDNERLAEIVGTLGGLVENQGVVLDYYSKARSAADDWRRARHDFMLAKLKKGEHPDTHAGFWDDFVEPRPPALPDTLSAGTIRDRNELGLKIALAAVPVALLCYIAIRIVWNHRTDRRTSAA